jgi:hypothetical protein
METLTMYNGNDQKTEKGLPKIEFITKYINPTALEHIKKQTGLEFVKKAWSYEAQPTSSNQITRLFLTYNFKTRYYDNMTYSNTLMIKSDHHIGFDVDHICFNCCESNHIVTNGLDKDSKLAC